jgi:phytol kinase
MEILVTVLVVGLLLLANEWWWRGRTHGEASRKFIHITVGSFVAFWPLYLGWLEIELLSLAFVVAVLISQQLNLLKTIHSVQRPTWGEVFFGLSVGSVALLTHNPAVYAVALLHMSLADGLAAILGVRYGASNAYQLFNIKKSLAGTATFAVVSTLILIGFAAHQQTGFHPAYVLVIITATLIENVGVKGLDNLLVPLLVAVVLQQIV